MTTIGPKHIMQVTSGLSAGGMERIAVSFANTLAEMGYGSHFLCTRGVQGVGPLGASVSDKVHLWSSRREKRWDIAGMKRIASYIDSNQIDLVHSHNHTSSYLMRIAFLFCKHKPLHVVHDHHGPALYDKKLGLYDWLFLRNVDAYIAVTEELRQRASRLLKLPEDQCLFLPNGIDIFEPHEPWQGRPTVVHVANFIWPKNHALSVRVAAIVRKQIPDLHWICVGRIFEPIDDYTKEVLQLIDSLDLSDCVTLTGVRNDVRELLRESNIGVLTSDSEGFPISVLEYMAEQLPVVVTSVGQCPSLITDAHAGATASPGDAEKFAENVIHLLHNPQHCQELGTHGRQYVIKHYSVDEMVRQVRLLYSKLMSEKQ